MKLICLFLVINLSVYAQNQLSFEKTSNASTNEAYFIKTDGKISHVEHGRIELISNEISCGSILVKPEGVLILGTGKEIILKNGEISDLNGTVKKASDSTLMIIRLNQLTEQINLLEKENKLLKLNIDLANKKFSLLEKKTDLINKKADLSLQRINTEEGKASSEEVKELNKQIADTEKEIKVLPRYFSRY